MALKDGTVEDYMGASVRHFADAGALKSGGAIDNAAHLIGFAAECAIKLRVGELTSDSLNLHLPDLLIPARKRLGTRAGYVGMYNLLKDDIFRRWSIDYRYAPTGSVSEESYQEWEGTTKRLMAAAGIKARQNE